MHGSKRTYTNNSEVLPIKDAVVQGIAFDAVLVVNEDSGLPANWYGRSLALGANRRIADFSKVNVRISVKKANKEFPEDVLNMRLDRLVCSTNHNSVNYRSFRFGRYVRWRDAGYTSATISANVIFPVGVFNIEKGDKMNITLQISGSDWLANSNGNPDQKFADINKSYIDFRPIMAHDDVDKRVSPRAFSRNMPYNQDQEPFFLGDNVTKIDYYTEIDDAPLYSQHVADDVGTILNADIYSKQLSLRFDEYDVHREHMTNVEDAQQATYSFGHYELYEGEELDNTKVTLRLKERAINANSEASLIFWAFQTDPVTFDRAILSEKKTIAHQKEKIKNPAM